MTSYLGIDVSKGYSDFVLLNESLEKLDSPFQLDDTIIGHEKFKRWLQESITAHKIDQVYSAVESTGGFENNWFSLVSKLSKTLPIQISRLNPSVVKNSAKANLDTQVTDGLSARNIALYIARYHGEVDYDQQENEYRSYRSFQNHITLLTKQKTQLINELKQLLYTCFPDLQRFCKSSIPDWVLSLLIKYPTARKLSKARLSSITRINGITQAKATTLLDNTKNSVASRSYRTDGFLIQCMAEDVKSKQKRIDLLKKNLIDNCQGPEVELLETIKGIGIYSAASIMIQIEDISRFPSPKHLASYFGLHPTIKESGDKRSVSRMSKAGRPAIRALLFMCANSAVIYDEHFKTIYANQRAKGKAHKQAIGVVMHKMLRIIWGVLNNKTPYKAEIDMENQKKANTKEVNSISEIKNKRRLQDYDSNAPISRIANKKRKVHQASQVSNAEQERDLADVPETNL